MFRLSKILILLTLFLLFFNTSCNDEDRVPYVPVNLQLFLNSADYQDLKISGNWKYISGGSRGIIVFCVYPGEYMAFDRNCTYDPYNDSARIYVDETNMFAVCEHCSSKFNLYDGTVVSGDAPYSLVQYSTQVDNDVLYINNSY
ncbi:MAG TPA: hypothetical protein PLZ52_03110 [Bacteroidales bacterium]|nr:hypothetical protein [Bacteroidales bacterium]HOE04182.1 hypothetical protein [Bacteroidales bacterium]